jgi:excisionase family DNA binding protein
MNTMGNLDSDLLTPTEVAQHLRVSRSWIYEAAKEGRIPCVRLGGPDGPVRVVRTDVDGVARTGTGRAGFPARHITRRAARAAPGQDGSAAGIDPLAGEA